MNPQATPPPMPGTSWFSRNLKWFLPTLILAGLALIVTFVASIFFFVFSIMSSSEPYKIAFASASHDPNVLAALGSPIKAGWFASGQIQTSNASGRAQIAIPVSGPSGKGTIFLKATKSAEGWSFSTLTLRVNGSGKMIPLVDGRLEPEKPGIW